MVESRTQRRRRRFREIKSLCLVLCRGGPKYSRADLLQYSLPKARIQNEELLICEVSLNTNSYCSATCCEMTPYVAIDVPMGTYSVYSLPSVVDEPFPQYKQEVLAAQSEAARCRDAEQSSQRFTFEFVQMAKARETDYPKSAFPCEMYMDNVGEYIMAHVDIALREYAKEHRRPYLLRIFEHLSKQAECPIDVGRITLKILDRFAPKVARKEIGGPRVFYCSVCQACYSQMQERCLVCCSQDIVDVLDLLGRREYELWLQVDLEDSDDEQTSLVYIGHLAKHMPQKSGFRCDECHQSLDPEKDGSLLWWMLQAGPPASPRHTCDR